MPHSVSGPSASGTTSRASPEGTPSTNSS
jgi:hypothetical protein